MPHLELGHSVVWYTESYSIIGHHREDVWEQPCAAVALDGYPRANLPPVAPFVQVPHAGLDKHVSQEANVHRSVDPK